jgi:hypothetical protein
MLKFGRWFTIQLQVSTMHTNTYTDTYACAFTHVHTYTWYSQLLVYGLFFTSHPFSLSLEFNEGLQKTTLSCTQALVNQVFLSLQIFQLSRFFQSIVYCWRMWHLLPNDIVLCLLLHRNYLVYLVSCSNSTAEGMLLLLLYLPCIQTTVCICIILTSLNSSHILGTPNTRIYIIVRNSVYKL